MPPYKESCFLKHRRALSLSPSPNQRILILLPHLHQAVPHQPQQQTGTILLLHTGRALCPHHACEVKSRDIRPSMGIQGKFQLPKLAVGGKVSSCPGKVLQSLGYHIGTAQQPVGLRPVLHGQQMRTSPIPLDCRR